MNTPHHTGFPRIDRIFHATDFTEASEIAYAHALRFTLALQSTLTVMHVADQEEDVEWRDFPGVRETLERWGLLPEGSQKEDLRNLNIDVSKVIGRKKNPVDSVLDYLEDHHADLIVLATHQNPGRNRWTHKSVAEPIARECHELTLFVPHGIDGFVSVGDGSVSLKNIVIPVDEHPRPQRAVDAAMRVAQEFACDDVTFTLVHVGEEGDMPAVHLAEQDGWRWEKRTIGGDVVEKILETTESTAADLIVMTTEGHHGFLDALRGSTTERVLRATPCPLLAIPRGA